MDKQSHIGNITEFIKSNSTTLIDISIKAGQKIQEVAESSFEIYNKEDSSPVTEADNRSNEIIMNGLQELRFQGNQIPVLSEEGVDIPYSERKGWDIFWCVDPLDGTKEFINKRDSYTTNIALIVNRKPVAGFVYLPAQDILYWGLEGYGALRIDKASEEKSCTEKIGQKNINSDLSELKIVASLSHLNEKTKSIIDKAKTTYDNVSLVQAGSSLKFCFVADGSADLYPRLAPTMEWDTAAADAVCRASGCHVLNVDTLQPLLYNKENLLNPCIITSANLELIKELI